MQHNAQQQQQQQRHARTPSWIITSFDGGADSREAVALVRGAAELARTARGVLPHRLPAWARAQIADDPQIMMAEAQPSGVRIAFRTAATAVEVDVLAVKHAYIGALPRPEGVYDLVVDGRLAGQAHASGGNTVTTDLATGRTEIAEGAVGTVRFGTRLAPEGEPKDVEIWLPHNETAELVALRADAPVEPLPDRALPVWLHHGSSISQGSDAASPSTTWPALAAAHGGVELVNLGLGGGALLDPFTARTMRDTPADLLSVKIGINLVNADLMRLRAFTASVNGFLDTVREGHPAAPLLVISPVYCPLHEDTPGPGAFDFSAPAEGKFRFRATGDPAETAAGKLTLNVVREELARIVQRRSADDPHLRLLDGRDLYGEADHAELPLPDGLHPDAATHRRIGERFAAHAFTENGPLAPGRAC